MKKPGGESHGQPPHTGGSGSGGQKLTHDDALQYLKEVKEMFQDETGKYEQFLGIMKDFKSQAIETEGVIARVKELFKGHNNLIYGFNTFLPKGYEITLDEKGLSPKKMVEFDEALNFVTKIKERFQNDDKVYKSFLKILNKYRIDHISYTEVYDEISQLFEEHSDLVDEFTRFLPHNSSGATDQHPQHRRSKFPRQNERSSAAARLRRIHADKRWNNDRDSSSHDHELTHDHADLDDEKEQKVHRDPREHYKDNKDSRQRDDDRETEHNNINNRDLNKQCLPDQMKPRKVEDFGASAVSTTSDDKNTLKSIYNQEFIFCEKVKEKLGNSDDYQAFLKCLHIYSTEIITRSELQSLVADLLGRYPDLMEGFNEFLEHCENIDGFLADVMNKKSLWNDGHIPHLMKTVNKDKATKRATEASKEKPNRDYSSKSIHEIELSDSECCTPSYRLLPDDYPIPTVSQRSELGVQVLNDHWVSVTSGSEDFSFKHMRRNQYEESLFRCEDDRFELDMLLESVSSTAKCAEDLLNNIDNNSISVVVPFPIEDYFTPLNLRCTERLYGDHGLDAIDMLRKSPAQALSIILTRLKQKQEEWTKSRKDFNKVWAEIYAKNHYKSLDHRSFYFKQQDSKNLSSKSLVAEIIEIKETMQKEDDLLLAVAVGNKWPLVPHLKFEYSDNDVNEDLYKLIQYSCEEICTTKEQLNKVMKLWTSFMEPILGVASRAHGVDGIEDVKACNQTAGKGVGGVIEKGGSAGTVAATVNHGLPKLGVSGGKNLLAHTAKCSTTNGDTTTRENEFGTADGEPEQLHSPQNDAQDGQVAKSPIDTIQSSLRVPPDGPAAALANGTFTQSSKANQCLEESAGHSKVDHKGKLSVKNHRCQDTNGDDHGAINESEVDDNENTSGAGNLSGSQSAGDECSREHFGEEENVKHNKLESKAESKGESQMHDMGDGTTLALSNHFLLSVKPLTKYVSLASQDADKKYSHVFYGNDSFYVLFRLHQTLYERILSTKMSLTSQTNWRNSKDVNPLHLYSSFLGSLYHLLDGTSDNAKFEDDCREIVGNQSYVLFTLDKLIYKLVKQLQAVASDEMDNKLLQLHNYEKSRKHGSFLDSVYHENARVLLHKENVYRFQFSSSPACLSIQLTDKGNEKSEMVVGSIEPNFAAYLFNDFLPILSAKKEPHNVLLRRSKRKYDNLDEHSATSKAMEDAELFNGLECKMKCNSSKILYVLDTEDVFFRSKKRRKSLPACLHENLDQARVHRFHRLLSAAL